MIVRKFFETLEGRRKLYFCALFLEKDEWCLQIISGKKPSGLYRWQQSIQDWTYRQGSTFPPTLQVPFDSRNSDT